MRIVAADLNLSAQHALTQTHSRRESLAAGIVSGAWDADRVEVSRQRERALPAAAADPPHGEADSLLEEYLGVLGPRRARQVRAAQAGADLTPAAAGAGGAAGRGVADLPAGLAGLGLPDLEALRRSLDGAGTAGGTGAELLTQAHDVSALRRSLGGAWTAGRTGADLLTQADDLSTDGAGPSGADLLARIQALVAAQQRGAMGPAAAPFQVEAEPQERLKMDLIRAAVEAFTGRTLPWVGLADLDPHGSRGASPPPVGAAGPTAGTGASSVAPTPTFGLVYQVRDTHTERETTSFQAQGTVRTADGAEIAVDVRLTMDRQWVREESAEVRVGAAVLQDPLVVNFGGTAAQLTQRTYDFDLDTDGAAEQIHFVGPGSGFLAWDRNANGAVDDGGELFGPRSGQGFTELAAHDDDGNGFIDEGDAVWAGLRIWEKDGAGSDRLLALAQRGVGAIWLGHADTPFQVSGTDGQLQGVVRSTGVYLREDGGAGTVQHLDLVV